LPYDSVMQIIEPFAEHRLNYPKDKYNVSLQSGQNETEKGVS